MAYMAEILTVDASSRAKVINVSVRYFDDGDPSTTLLDHNLGIPLGTTLEAVQQEVIVIGQELRETLADRDSSITKLLGLIIEIP